MDRILNSDIEKIGSQLIIARGKYGRKNFKKDAIQEFRFTENS